MSDEEGKFDCVTRSLAHDDLLLCAEVKEQHQCCMHVNNVCHHKLLKLFALKGFKGSHDVGTHLGSTALTIHLPGRDNHILVDEGTEVVVVVEEEEEEDEAEMARLEQFISNVSQT